MTCFWWTIALKLLSTSRDIQKKRQRDFERLYLLVTKLGRRSNCLSEGIRILVLSLVLEQFVVRKRPLGELILWDLYPQKMKMWSCSGRNLPEVRPQDRGKQKPNKKLPRNCKKTKSFRLFCIFLLLHPGPANFSFDCLILLNER